MKIMRHFMLIVLVGMGISTTLNASNAKRPWLFFVYMAADNNLNPDADDNIAQMMQASSSTNVYIVVCLNIKRSDEVKKTEYLVIQNGTSQIMSNLPAQDSGNENTLINSLAWAIANYPSDKILVDMWDHGSGSLNRAMRMHRGVCYDDTYQSYMTDLKYKRAFDVIVNQHRGGKKIDIIAFDACLMADIEVAFTLAPYANYLVSSQQTVPGPGFNYTSVLTPFAKSNPDPVTFARSMVASYDAYYKTSGQNYTLCAMNLAKLPAAVTATNTIAQLLTNALSTDTTGAVSSAIAASADPANCPHFDEPTYLDVYTFYSNLYGKISHMNLSSAEAVNLRTALRNGMRGILQTVFANVHSSNFAKVKGMSIYVADVNAGVEPSYAVLDWTVQNPAWNSFLNTYVGIANPS